MYVHALTADEQQLLHENLQPSAALVLRRFHILLANECSQTAGVITGTPVNREIGVGLEWRFLKGKAP